ncbi:hypothetical protein Clacol_007617 [Clathrus columnatus]|uniref:Uncharacterized protein n=1 Tax=Clathrus columnatus TaxID=1419009 RepID=A0AAV5AGA2_9AGAM|nr:hypothetical protein Clacol_007617 [Clathrus columnatus]
MPKTNSESDFGGSLTSDAEDNFDVDPPSSPLTGTTNARQQPAHIITESSNRNRHPKNKISISSSKHTASRANPLSPSTSHIDRQSHNGYQTRPSLRGIDLFRAAAHKVIRMHRTSSFWGTLNGGKAGAEPGVDPRHSSAHITYGHIRRPCSINVIEYNSVRSQFQSFKNQSFIDFLATQGTQKEPWAKVRWIHVAGLSWDVISKLALAYELHPLSLEDVLQDDRKLNRSKADYFKKHLFLRVLCHSVDDYEDSSSNIMDIPRTTSPLPLSKPSSVHNKPLLAENHPGLNRILHRGSFKRNTSFDEELEQGHEPPPYDEVESRTNSAEEAMFAVQKLKAGLRVNVVRRNLYMFLFRDGTLITLHETNTATFATPIMNRLRSTSTVLRTNSDASILLESILDLVVDQAMAVVEEYHKMLVKLESEVLLKPKVASVRHLHIISGDLALHKRTLEPLRSLIYGLRRYDYDRCVALETSSTNDSPETDTTSPKVIGFMSHKSKIYLADVNDHMEYILSSLDMFGGIAENLINYTFNMASYEMNEVME